MPEFGLKSKQKLSVCHGGIIRVMNEAIKIYDFTILSTYRGEAEQKLLYTSKLSKLQYPDSKHNWMPSHGIDIAPYPIDWDNRERFIHLAGIVLGIAHVQGILLRWGGDWDMDNDLEDQTFMDLGHFEVI